MSEERNPVICPWCGWEMVAREGQDIFHGKYHVYVCEACEAVSPMSYSEKAAYLEATRTPPTSRRRERSEQMNKGDMTYIMQILLIALACPLMLPVAIQDDQKRSD